MYSARRVVACLLSAEIVLSMAVAGCRAPPGGASCSSEAPIVVLQVSVSMEGYQTIVAVQARNVSSGAVYVCDAPTMETHKRREGPYTFYGGNDTLVLYWATTEHSPYVGGHGNFPEGAYVRRVEPGGHVTLRTQIPPDLKQDWPWSETLYCDFEAPFDEGRKLEDLAYAADRVLVIVAYWEADAIVQSSQTLPAEPDVAFFLEQKDIVPLAAVPATSYQSLVGQRALRLEPLDPACVGIKDIELLAQAGPVALPKPLTIRYRGVRWPEWKEKAGGQSPPISAQSVP